ncbi:hypothetical protein NC651_003132 [Populus alba x Populus x berolinensis]|nr:hypothetical protein NC651_003132 [Populus alba x Populus x berolinensis]
MEGVVKRLEEFRKGMRCLMDCIEGKGIGDLGVLRVYDECVRCNLERNENGSYRVQISANATKTAAELRRLLEQLMNGKTVNHGSLTPIVLQLLSSRDSIMLVKSVQQQMRTCILFDRQNLTIRIFGPVNLVAVTEQKLVASLLARRDKQQTDIRL